MTTASFRLESDSLGTVEVPKDALWGAQTQRAIQNFPSSGLRLPRTFIRALGLIKHAAAGANATAKPDADGATRLVIAAEDPGHPNWLPTGGRSCGAILHRRINAEDAPGPRCELFG